MRKRHLYDNPSSPEFRLGALRAFSEFVQAQRQDPRLTMASHAKGRNVDTNTWLRHLTAIESEVGCELVRREVTAPKQGSKASIAMPVGEAIPGHAEGETAVPAATEHNDKEAAVVRTSEVTLDGEIWAEFGALTLKLYELARNATDLRPAGREDTLKNSAVSKRAQRIIPRSNADSARHGFLLWLKSQNAAIDKAADMSVDSRTPVHELVTMSHWDDDGAPDFEWGERAPYDPALYEIVPEDDDPR